jgi:hypothetical protein
VATSHVEAMESKGILDFGMQSVDAHTQIAASGLTSVAAQSFIAQSPKAHAAFDLFRRISPNGFGSAGFASAKLRYVTPVRRYSRRHVTLKTAANIVVVMMTKKALT